MLVVGLFVGAFHPAGQIEGQWSIHVSPHSSIHKGGGAVSELTKQSREGGIPAIIGRGTTIIGSIHSGQDLILDGELEGELDVENRSLTIGPHGKVVANAKAREVDIQGNMTGNIESSGKTCIRSSGSLVGDVVTRGIVIENGAVFKGNLEIVTRPNQNGEVKNGE
jgi:cytoskeletal protein CcmA (bactofilin family)